jgi:protein-S-isoprenylcysteine O-methyltransferase Ste14
MGGGPGWHFAEWLLGIVGGIGVFLGFFTLFASDDSSIGLGGDWSWEVGEISPSVAYGLLIGGAILLGAAVAMIVMGRHRVRQTAIGDRALSDLLWHAGIFLVVNAFIWAQDIAMGGGVDYAFWITIPWGIGLTIHAATFFQSRRTLDKAP